MHDQNFKNLILDYPRQSLEFFAAPEAKPDLTAAEITPVRQEQLKDRLGERFRELDTPLLVEWSDGLRQAVLFIIEEESYPGKFSIHRLAHYCLDIAELMKTDRVVPVVIFLKSGTHAQSLTLGTEYAAYLNFQYIACDLFRIPAEEHLYSDNIVARLNLPNMAYAPENRLLIYHSAQVGLSTLEPNVNKQRKYVDFIDNYANLSDDEVMQYKEQYFEKEVNIMGLAHVLREEGRQEGGFNILKRQMTRRFGILPEWARERLENAGSEQIEAWAETLLDAKSIEEIFAD